MLRPEKKTNKLSLLQAYYKMHFPRYKEEIETRWAAVEVQNKVPGAPQQALVNCRNVWMKEFFDAESEEIKAAVAEYRATYNKALESEDVTTDWAVLDSETCGTENKTPSSVTAKEPDANSSTSLSAEGASTSDSTSHSTSEPREISPSEEAKSTSEETQISTANSDKIRIQQLEIRQR